MRLPKFIFALIAGLALTPFLAGEQPSTPSILPNQFAGWQLSDPAHQSSDPGKADPANASLLKEYGFTGLESAVYVRSDGRKLTVKAARFADASGAYGAFTYYKMPQMRTETIGDQGSSLNERVLFYRGNVLVDALFEKLTAMSAAELRDLAGAIRLPAGNTRNLPDLPTYLPRDSYVKNTAKYVIGPVGLQKISSPLPADIIDFSAGAEVVLGNYGTSAGESTLMLISYPTAQIAIGHLRRLEEARQLSGQTVPSANAGHIFMRRTGPIVVVAAGPLGESEAGRLLASVNYEANVTWNEKAPFSKRDNIGNIVWNALLLCGILMLFSLVAGLAFGGLRILLRRRLPEKDRGDEVEFISLHLAEQTGKPRDIG